MGPQAQTACREIKQKEGEGASQDLLKQAPRGPCPRLRLLQHGPVHQEIQAPERLQGAAQLSVRWHWFT